MNAWFTRANGETTHNQPGSKGFMHGEPPNYPNRSFNYREDCLTGRFARAGFPAAGDLRELGWRNKAREAYGEVPPHLLANLERFAAIRVGDLIVMPAGGDTYDVHLGIAVPNPKNPTAKFGAAPYYYHYEIAVGDWLENAHRVPVQWHQEASGKWAVFSVPELGGLWRKSFGRIGQARDALIEIALSVGIEVSPLR